MQGPDLETMAILLGTLVASIQGQALAGSNWAGVNSFFAHALPTQGPFSRTEYLDHMKASRLKVLRIFLSKTPSNYKQSGSVAVNDLETEHVGAPYDDTILHMVDDLMKEAFDRGIKLDIALHDRYALGCWTRDAYVTTFHLPDTSQGPKRCDTQLNQVEAFYSDPVIQEKFDERLAHVLRHVNPHFQHLGLRKKPPQDAQAPYKDGIKSGPNNNRV